MANHLRLPAAIPQTNGAMLESDIAVEGAVQNLFSKRIGRLYCDRVLPSHLEDHCAHAKLAWRDKSSENLKTLERPAVIMIEAEKDGKADNRVLVAGLTFRLSSPEGPIPLVDPLLQVSGGLQLTCPDGIHFVR